MTSLNNIISFLESFAPPALSEEWDNTGLLIGDRDQPNNIASVITCLTLTPDVAEEAIAQNAKLIVTHHPILFRPVQSITSETLEGGMILQLIQSGIAVYSPHTSYDSAQEGINQQLAQSLGLTNVGILRPVETESSADENFPASGAGRYGDFQKLVTLSEVNNLIKDALKIETLQFVGQPDAFISRIGIACGAAAEFMHDAKKHECDALLTGEARFHDCLAARGQNIGLITAGHYATERPAIEFLASRLQQEFENLNTWCSQNETDPQSWA